MLSRIQVVVILCCALAVGRASGAQCAFDGYGNYCIAEVDFSRFAQEAYQSQLQDQWCWAASISMVFEYYDHPVEQARLVREAYGSEVNLPGSGATIAAELNRDWVDDNGGAFSSRLSGLFDANAGVVALSNQQMVEELDSGNPLIVGTNGHAMVVTRVDYYETVQGPNVVFVGVFDPWPGNGARALTVQEATPVYGGGSFFFLAAFRVQSIDINGPVPPPVYPPATGESQNNDSYSDSDGGGCSVSNRPRRSWASFWLSALLIAATRHRASRASQSNFRGRSRTGRERAPTPAEGVRTSARLDVCSAERATSNSWYALPRAGRGSPLPSSMRCESRRLPWPTAAALMVTLIATPARSDEAEVMGRLSLDGQYGWIEHADSSHGSFDAGVGFGLTLAKTDLYFDVALLLTPHFKGDMDATAVGELWESALGYQVAILLPALTAGLGWTDVSLRRTRFLGFAIMGGNDVARVNAEPVMVGPIGILAGSTSGHIVNWTVKGGLGGQVNDAAYDWMAATGMNLGVRFSDWGEIHSRGSAGYMAARSGRSHFAFAQIIIGVGMCFVDSSH